MKVKAIIWKHDGTNGGKVLRSRDRTNKTFTYKENVYTFEPGTGRTTTRRTWRTLWTKEYFNTFYYFEGSPKPFPVTEYLQKMNESPGRRVAIVNLGISAGELASIFEPWFYAQISRKESKLFRDAMFYLLLGSFCGVVWLVLKSQGIIN